MAFRLCIKACIMSMGLLFFQYTSYAQSKTDSLIEALSGATDSTRMELYYQLSEAFYHVDIGEASKFDSMGLLLAQDLGNRRQEGRFFNNLGIDYYFNSDFKQSHFYFSQAQAAFNHTRDTARLVMALNNLGAVYKTLGLYKLSADHYAEAINLKQREHDTTSLVTTFNNISLLYDKIGLSSEGLSFLDDALQLALILNDSSLISLTYQNLGAIQVSQMHYKKAIKYSEKALELNRSMRGNDICPIYNNLALSHEGLGDAQKAENYYQLAFSLFDDKLNESEKAVTLQNYASFLTNQGDIDGAIATANKALSIAEKHRLTETIRSTYKLLATNYQSRNNFKKAYSYLMESNRWNDSINSNNLAASLMLININERIIEARHEQMLLEKQNQLQAQQISYGSKLLNFMITASVILLILFGIIIYYVVRKRKDNQKLTQLNKQLGASEEKYKAVVEQSPQLMFIHQDGKLLFANQHFYKLSGHSPDELSSLSIFDLVHPDEKEGIIRMARERMLGETPMESYELKALNNNKQEVFLNMSFSRITYNDQPAILGVGIDISGRKKNLETIKKLTAAIEQSPIMILITNKEGNIEYTNPAFSKITGYTPEEALNNNPRMLSSGMENIHIYKELWGTILNGNIWRGELLNKKKNGELYWESLVISPILNERNMITHFVAVMEDISERKSIQEALQQREEALRHANITKDKFFSIIAHDLKNPFNAIIGFTSLLMAEYDNIDDIERRSYIENIHLASNTTYRLLENLLEWSRTQTGKIKFTPSLFDLSAAVNEVTSLQQTQAAKKGLKVISEIPFNTNVFADKNMIKTVLRNLISNAIKFTSSGEIRITAKKKKEHLEVCVSDTGIGIPESGIDKIFKLDEQYLAEGTEFEKGTGIGLILSKEFINKHEGSIWVKSKKNMGSKFCFTLPTNKSHFN